MCAKRFHRPYSGQPALLYRCYRGTSTVQHTHTSGHRNRFFGREEARSSADPPESLSALSSLSLLHATLSLLHPTLSLPRFFPVEPAVLQVLKIKALRVALLIAVFFNTRY